MYHFLSSEEQLQRPAEQIPEPSAKVKLHICDPFLKDLRPREEPMGSVWDAQTDSGSQKVLRDGPTHCQFWSFHGFVDD